MSIESSFTKIIKTLGKIPGKVPADVKYLEETDCDTYIRHTISYNVMEHSFERNERIKAYLLVPKSINGKIPAIVAAHQHAGQFHWGKCEPAGLDGKSEYFYGHELAARGYVVICPDHIGFEERWPGEDEVKKRGFNDRRDAGRAYQCELVLKAYSVGSTMQAKYISDLSAAVDILCGLLYVDGERIGVIGHSIGGLESLWLTFYDRRVKAGVSNCGFTTMKSGLDNQNFNYAFVAECTFGLIDAGDTPALLEQIAENNKAFMMINGTQDLLYNFMEGVYANRDAAIKAYAEKGISEKFQSIVFDGGHTFPDEIRKQAYEFLDRWL